MRLSFSCEVEAGGWTTEDDNGRKAVVGRLPLNPLATYVLENSSSTAGFLLIA